MPQIDIDGANSKISPDKIQRQSGTTVTVPTGHTVAITDSGGLTLAGTAVNAGVVANKVHVRYDTRSLGTASGNVSYTGVGFQPNALFIMWARSNTADTGPCFAWLVDTAQSSISGSVANQSIHHNEQETAGSWRRQSTIYLKQSTPNYVTATVNSWDSDGYTIAFTNTGSLGGTLDMVTTCFKF